MKDMKIIPLGTVSPFCKNNKNCPGYLVKYGDQNLLLDCGNGVTRLLNIPDDLKNLTIIISHLHPDHYGDLNALLQGIYVYRKLGYIDSTITLYVPKYDEEIETESFINEDGWWDSTSKKVNILDYRIIEKYAKIAGVNFVGYGNINTKIGDMKVSTLEVPHQVKSYAIKVQTEDGTLVYSGDTGTNNNLRQFASNADLFICESTYLKGQFRDSDNHLYASEAAQIASDAKVGILLLTHFWPDIDKQKYVDEALPIFDCTEAAEEGKEFVLRRDNRGRIN